MDSLLKRMVDMTGHRDHAMLDLSVISAVQELAGAERTRVLSLIHARGQIFLRTRATVVDGVPARLEDHGDSLGDPIDSIPELAACIRQRAPRAEGRTADGALILWLPIWMGDAVNTCLEIVHRGAYGADTEQTIGGIVGVYRNFQNLLDYSERDSLTGLLNRKTFDDQLAKMLQSAQDAPAPNGQEERRQLCGDEKQWLAVVDVDHFKHVNDRFGHLYGDEVLILIANLLQSSFRAQDRVFRFGGEEFVVLLRSATRENARKIIERFRTNVEAHDFPQVGRVTVSVGYVSIGTFDPPVIVLGRADQALYYAKANGRNQACQYEALVEGGQLQTAASNDTAEFF
jgi:diguanylate cyclase (GGDEF)-like protein